MKKILSVAFGALLLISCRKDSDNTSIVGVWNLTNASAYIYSAYTDSTSFLQKDTFISPRFIQSSLVGVNGIYTSYGAYHLDTAYFYREQWTLNSDASFSVSESYQFVDPAIRSSYIKGIWQMSDQGALYFDIIPGGIAGIMSGTNNNGADLKAFQVASLSAHQLVLESRFKFAGQYVNSMFLDSAIYTLTFNR